MISQNVLKIKRYTWNAVVSHHRFNVTNNFIGYLKLNKEFTLWFRDNLIQTNFHWKTGRFHVPLHIKMPHFGITYRLNICFVSSFHNAVRKLKIVQSLKHITNYFFFPVFFYHHLLFTCRGILYQIVAERFFYQFSFTPFDPGLLCSDFSLLSCKAVFGLVNSNPGVHVV